MVAPLVASSLISGGASLIGGLMGNSASSKEAKKQRSWQEWMTKTAHQHEVSDMKLAGLNPMLSVMGGSGAAVPSGATAKQDDPISGAVNSALMAKRLDAELENISASNDKIRSDTDLNKAMAKTAQADALLKGQSARLAGANANLIDAKLPRSEIISELFTDAKKPIDWVRGQSKKHLGDLWNILRNNFGPSSGNSAKSLSR